MSKPTYQAAITNEVAQVLGRLIATFNALESQVESFIWHLLQIQQDIGQILTCELAFKQKFAVFGSLFRKVVDDPKLLDELDTTLKALDQAEQIRNRLAHSVYAAGQTDTSSTRFKTTAKAK